jgi:Double-GTPase 2
VKIVMLGHSDAGKTTYIAMMYEFMRKGFEGFTVNAVDGGHDRELRKSARDIGRGRYPLASSRREHHVFRLSHRRRYIADFTWTDYRGGVLTGRSDQEDTAHILAELAAADGVVVFVDAHLLATSDRGRREVRRLTVLLQQALEGRTGRVPVVIAYTKSDLLTGSDEWARASAPLANLRQALAASPTVLDTVVAVSCGRRPTGVNVPVLWCLAQHYAIRVSDLERELAISRRMANEARQRSNLWNSWRSTWYNEESEYRKSLRYQRWANEEAVELQPLRQPTANLLAALDKARAKTASLPPVGR